MGLPADLQVVADGMIGASMELVTTVMTGTRDTTLAVFHELDRQHGMSGDDDAGHDFAKVYTSAAAETLDQLGFSAYMIGEAGAGLMRSAREFIAQEDAVAAGFMGRQPDPTLKMATPPVTAPSASSASPRPLPRRPGTGRSIRPSLSASPFRLLRVRPHH